jgi:hypothetical protein
MGQDEPSVKDEAHKHHWKQDLKNMKSAIKGIARVTKPLRKEIVSIPSRAELDDPVSITDDVLHRLKRTAVKIARSRPMRNVARNASSRQEGKMIRATRRRVKADSAPSSTASLEDLLEACSQTWDSEATTVAVVILAAVVVTLEAANDQISLGRSVHSRLTLVAHYSPLQPNHYLTIVFVARTSVCCK